MGLLLSSKRAWLLSYAIFSFLAICLYFFALDSVIGKTALILISEMQILMMFFFGFIIIFKWKAWCRTILAILYLGGSIYFGINHIISKWYIIVPISIVLLVYMIWNMGGVVNCVVANKYKKKLERTLKEARESYSVYIGKVGAYNECNELGWFSKIRIKREPKWEKFEFASSGIEMFSIEKALEGVETLVWEKQLSEIDRINSRLNDKHLALDSNYSLFEEKETIGRINDKSRKLGIDNDTFEMGKRSLYNEIKRNRKKGKKILKRRL